MATRLYLSNLVADITPGFEAWGSTASTLRRQMVTSLFADALNNTAVNSTAGQSTCHRQYISEPMQAGVAFVTSGTFGCQVQGFESAANDNIINRVRAVKVVSRDGATLRSTLLALSNASTVTEWAQTITNLQFMSAAPCAANYTTVAGDRIVVELGHNDSAGLTIQGTCRWGADAAGTGDLGANETDTTNTLRPWFESSVDMTFEKTRFGIMVPQAVQRSAVW